MELCGKKIPIYDHSTQVVDFYLPQFHLKLMRIRVGQLTPSEWHIRFPCSDPQALHFLDNLKLGKMRYLASEHKYYNLFYIDLNHSDQRCAHCCLTHVYMREPYTQM